MGRSERMLLRFLARQVGGPMSRLTVRDKYGM